MALDTSMLDQRVFTLLNEGKTVEQIAQHFNCSVEAVKQYLAKVGKAVSRG